MPLSFSILKNYKSIIYYTLVLNNIKKKRKEKKKKKIKKKKENYERYSFSLPIMLTNFAGINS